MRRRYLLGVLAVLLLVLAVWLVPMALAAAGDSASPHSLTGSGPDRAVRHSVPVPAGPPVARSARAPAAVGRRHDRHDAGDRVLLTSAHPRGRAALRAGAEAIAGGSPRRAGDVYAP